MATSVYFNNFPSGQITSEQLLVEDLLIESMQIHGMDVFYLPRTSRDSVDQLFGEDTLKQYLTAYNIEMYLENVTGMEGEGDFISKFGFAGASNRAVTPVKSLISPASALLYNPFTSRSLQVAIGALI